MSNVRARIDLLKAVATRFVAAARKDVPKFLADNVDAAMEKQLQAFIAGQVKNRKRTRALLGLVVGSKDDEGLRAQLADNVKTLREVTARVLRRDIDDPDIDITLATFWGLAIMHIVTEGQRPDEVTDAILQRFAEVRAEANAGRPPGDPPAPKPAATPRRKRG